MRAGREKRKNMRRFILVFLLVIFGWGIFSQRVFSRSDTILIIIANRGFRDEEFFTPYNFFQREGFKVVVASDKRTEATGMLGGKFLPDLAVENIDNIDKFAAIILPGGIGSTVFWNNAYVKGIIKDAYGKGKVIGALCLSPVTLAKAGILKGKRATVWYSEANYLRSKGVRYVSEDVVVDDNIVTASGPQTAAKFAQEVINLLRRKK